MNIMHGIHGASIGLVILSFVAIIITMIQIDSSYDYNQHKTKLYTFCGLFLLGLFFAAGIGSTLGG